MDINYTTGLPELPEGYWWRVKREDIEHYGSWVSVNIMRRVPKRSFWTDKPHPTKTTTVVFVYSYERWEKFASATAPKVRIFEIAAHVLRKAEDRWRTENQADEVTDLLGDYPPKRL